ncbi:MAG: hypothetical protein ACI8V2_004634 [Candidatus Latescibacterota bacterium]|jgi:hypothetical protein
MATETPIIDRMTEEDRQILKTVDGFLSDGRAFKSWWDDAYTSDGFSERFDLVHTLHRPEKSFGFFGKAKLESGKMMPVMGVRDELFYDQPKASGDEKARSAEWICEQVKEFVLHYFLRVSDFRLPEKIVEPSNLPKFLQTFMKPKESIQRKGMGFSQVYYKLADTGQIGKFEEETAQQIIDLREIGKTYEWIALNLQVFDFSVTMRPLGADAPSVTMPLKESTYLILTPEFITNIDNPRPGVLGEYGFGYAFVKNPHRGPFAYGPGEFEAAFQTINFKVMDTGEVRLIMTFVSDQPEKIMNLSFDPVNWSFDLADFMSFGMTSRVFKPIKHILDDMPFKAENVDPTIPALDFLNAVTGGQIGEKLDVRKERLYKGFLTQHSMQHYQTLLGSLRTWRQISNWLDTDALPDWVIEGKSS